MAEEGKRALIIGASRGIGLGLAREFAGRGWRVTGTVRKPGDAAALEAVGATVAQADIDRPETIDALADTGGYDLVFVNAGVSGPKHQSVEEATADEVGALFTTNAVAPVRTARQLLPSLAEGGTIAFTSSILGSTASADGTMPLYSASKAALNMLAHGFAQTEATDHPVLILHPGWVRTDMGGPNATLSVEESAAGLADVVEATTESGDRYLDYSGQALPW